MPDKLNRRKVTIKDIAKRQVFLRELFLRFSIINLVVFQKKTNRG